MKKQLIMFVVLLCLVGGCGGGRKKGLAIVQNRGDEELALAFNIRSQAMVQRDKYYYTYPVSVGCYFDLVPVEAEDLQMLPSSVEMAWEVGDESIFQVEQVQSDYIIMRPLPQSRGTTTVTATRLDTGESATVTIEVLPSVRECLNFNFETERLNGANRYSDFYYNAEDDKWYFPYGYYKHPDFPVPEILDTWIIDESVILPTTVEGRIQPSSVYFIRDHNGSIWGMYGSMGKFAFKKLREAQQP